MILLRPLPPQAGQKDFGIVHLVPLWFWAWGMQHKQTWDSFWALLLSFTSTWVGPRTHPHCHPHPCLLAPAGLLLPPASMHQASPRVPPPPRLLKTVSRLRHAGRDVVQLPSTPSPCPPLPVRAASPHFLHTTTGDISSWKVAAARRSLHRQRRCAHTVHYLIFGSSPTSPAIAGDNEKENVQVPAHFSTL